MFKDMIKKAIHKSQHVQRNWDLSKSIPQEDMELIAEAITQAPSKQNVQFFKPYFITDRDKIERVHRLTPGFFIADGKQGGKAPRGANMGGMMSGGPRKKATASSTGLSMNMGGMMSGQKKKKDQSSATGLAMKKGGMAYGKKGYKHGGMTDYRKSGMFRGGATRRGK